MRKYNSEESPELEVISNTEEKPKRKTKEKTFHVQALVGINFSDGSKMHTGQQLEVSETEFNDRYSRLVEKGYLYLKRD